jgi:energy-coupling factor transporter ATP-binding protein EcfA2
MSKIAKLKIKDFIGIEEIEIKVGKVNLIKGVNGKGKTTILEAIQKAISNSDKRTRVIRDGTQKAELFVELDNGLEISRNLTKKGGNYLTVRKDGFNQNSPQTLLNSLVGAYSFNPVEFIAAKPKEQAEVLLNIFDIKLTEEEVQQWVGNEEPLPPVDFGQHGLKVIEALYKAFYEKRRLVKVEAQLISNSYGVEAAKIPPEFNPEEYRGISLRDKYDELKKAQDHNRIIDKSKSLIRDIDLRIESTNKEIERIEAETIAAIKLLEEKISELKRRIEEKKQTKETVINGYLEQIEALLDRKTKGEQFLAESKPIDTAPLEKEVEEFEEKKGLVATYDTVHRLAEEKKEYDSQIKGLENIVQLLKDKPQEIIKKAKFPISGLTIEGDNVSINSRPISDLSEGEKIKIALEIARVTSGELKIVCVDGIEVLDPDNKKIFMEEIKKDDMQYFITQATGDEELTIESVVGNKTIDPETGEVLEGGVPE